MRHTIDVLRDYGNLSSGSFLFSYERLLAEGKTKPGDYGVLMTMGPGSTIETALVQWLPDGGQQGTQGPSAPSAPSPTAAIRYSGWMAAARYPRKWSPNSVPCATGRRTAVRAIS
jgi:hypothetical protein